MGRFSSNLAFKESLESGPEGQIRPLSHDKLIAARQALTDMPTKDMAAILKISERTVNKWKVGAAPIPADRYLAIIQAHLVWVLERLPHLAKCAQILSDEVSRIYGPRNGHASREVF